MAIGERRLQVQWNRIMNPARDATAAKIRTQPITLAHANDVQVIYCIGAPAEGTNLTATRKGLIVQCSESRTVAIPLRQLGEKRAQKARLQLVQSRLYSRNSADLIAQASAVPHQTDL